MMKKPLISIIVPVYNVEKYLDRCVKSLLEQDYENIEIVLIDDGSTDSSPVICDKYAEKYLNIVVYHKENGGQSSARNVGLRLSRGEYIGFVDSDDWVATDMYSYLYSLIEHNNAEISSVWFKYAISNDDIYSNIEEHVRIIHGDDILVDHLKEAMKSGAHSVWRCLFKRDVCATITFPEGYFNEDLPYKFSALSKANTYVTSDLVKYFYFQGGTSTTRGKFKLRDLDLIEMSNSLYDLAKPYGGEIEYLARIKKYRADFSILSRIAYYGSVENVSITKSVIKKTSSNLRKNYLDLLFSPIPISRKVVMTLLCVNFKLTKIAVILIKKALNYRR